MNATSSMQPLNPTRIDEYVQQVISCLQQGQFKVASELSSSLVRLAPNHAGAAYSQASCLLALKSYGQAIAFARRAAALEPRMWEAHYLTGRILKAQGMLQPAIEAYRRALSVSSDMAVVHTSLGIALRAAGRNGEAIDAYDRALALEPDSYEARHNLGNALKEAGREDEAVAALTQAGAVRRAEATRLCVAGIDAATRGDAVGARALLERAAELAPHSPWILENLGAVLIDLYAMRECVPYFRKIHEMHGAANPAALCSLASVLAQLGETEEAVELFDNGRRMHPEDGPIQMRAATLMPPLQESWDSIAAWRDRCRMLLEERIARPIVTDRRRLLMAHPSFYLSYHGLCNRELAQLLSRAVLLACPELEWVAPHVERGPRRSGPLRVGFISSLMRRHSIGRTTSGLVAELDRSRFRVHALFVPPFVDDELSRFIRDQADEALVLSAELEEARKQIAELELDVLFYQDVGMMPSTYYLAHSRLAPVQCLSFGHPDTSGIATMDWFVSSSLFEPDDAQEHYSERLHLIEGVGTLAYYYRPVLQQPAKSRWNHGFSVDDHIYLCPQTLFKVHPDFDAIVTGILDADRQALIVFVADRDKAWSELLHARLKRRIGPNVDRVRFLEQRSTADFLNLIAVADVMLDTVHFNGMNTSLEAFSMGVPVVTLPASMQRGRHTFGMYRRMGIETCVAADVSEYISIAVKLGTEPGFRAEVSQKILASCDVLFHDEAVVRGFERFFERACEEAALQQPLVQTRHGDG